MTEFWDKTIQEYGDFVSYPQLSEKYLKRPPFKYLFQIFASLNTKTKFSEGLFKEPELDPEFYDTPEKKLGFLKQLFKLVYKIVGKECPVKPQAIVKGVDCDKTNEFLRDMLVAAKSGKNYAKLLQGDQKSAPSALKETEKDTQPPKESEKPSKVEKNSAKETQIDKERIREKENVKDDRGGDRHAKVIQNALEIIAKEEKIIEKPRIESREQIDSGIKMGTLSLSGGKSGKNKASANGPAKSEPELRVADELNIEEMKQAIQRLTQNAGPLGKLIEFIDDDLDGMNKECKRWQKMHTESSAKLEKMESDLDEELQSYHDKLNEINEQIFDFDNKIYSLRSRVLKNGTKIDSALSKLISN